MVRPVLAPLLVSCFLACQASPDDSVQAEAPAGTPFTAPELHPIWTSAEAQEHAQAALDLGWPAPGVLADTFWGLVADYGDAVCPGEDALSTPNLQGCTADSGATFAGLAVWNYMTDTPTTQDWILSGDLVIVTPDGREFVGGGSAGARAQVQGGTTRVSTDVRGTWRFEGADAWLGEGVSDVFRAMGEITDARSQVLLDGVVGVGTAAMDLREVALASDVCDGHAIGVMAVRDPSGGWFELDSTDRCDGCFDVTWAGEPVDDICLDLRPATTELVEGLAL